jgi:hypothetical protein
VRSGGYLLITDKQNQATGDFVELISARLGSGRAIHPETAIAASARVAGSLLLRSFGFDLKTPEPGTVLLSTEANERGPALVNLMGAFLAEKQVELDATKLGGTSEHRGMEPNLNLHESLELLQADALAIAARYSLSLQEAAESAALATAFIVKECVASIGGETGFNVAAFGFVEGCKTVPPQLEKLNPPPTPKPWYKIW